MLPFLICFGLQPPLLEEEGGEIFVVLDFNFNHPGFVRDLIASILNCFGLQPPLLEEEGGEIFVVLDFNFNHPRFCPGFNCFHF
ncbi:MAG: hypothetical protein JXR31_07300 [Prolixibacteraceae bacterium]|nr:hypothetical protein [Prolixibacteraceae bacterium]